MKKGFFSYNYPLPASHALTIAWATVAFLAAETRAGTTYVISTDDGPVPPAYLQAIGASQGLNTPGYVFLSPSSLGLINGTPIHFAGYGDKLASFGVAGSLNLGNGDRILGLGANFLRIEVGADANL